VSLQLGHSVYIIVQLTLGVSILSEKKLYYLQTSTFINSVALKIAGLSGSDKRFCGQTKKGSQ